MKYDFEKMVDEVVGIYAKRKREKRKKGTRIVRGRAVTVSSQIEDYFARVIDDVLPNNKRGKKYGIMIDYPISFKPNKNSRTKTIYPDIMIVKASDGQKTVVGVIEFRGVVG